MIVLYKLTFYLLSYICDRQCKWFELITRAECPLHVYWCVCALLCSVCSSCNSVIIIVCLWSRQHPTWWMHYGFWWRQV